MLKELVKKIELQSVLVLFLTLLFGFLLLDKDNSLITPAGILGSACIGFGILYTFGSFFSNQIRESYKDVISEYKATISTLRATHRDVEKSYKDTLYNKGTPKQIGEYRTVDDVEEETQKD